MTFSRKTLVTIFLVAGILLCFFWLWQFVSSAELVSRATLFLKEASGVDKLFAGLILFLLSAISSLLGFFSTVALIPVATVLFGNLLTFCILFPAWVFGGLLAYGIGKTLGYRIVGIFVAEEKVNRFSKEVQDPELFLPAFLFRLVTPAETGYIFGLVSYPLDRYIFITALAELPFAIALVWGSSALLTSNLLQFSGLVLGSAVLLITAVYLSQKKVKKYLDNNKNPE